MRTAIVQVIAWAEKVRENENKGKISKMEIIKGHKFYDIWGQNDLLFVKGVIGRGYLINFVNSLSSKLFILLVFLLFSCKLFYVERKIYS